MKNIIKTFHTFKGKKVTLSRVEDETYPHSFEVYDVETDGSRYYVEGNLRIEQDIVQEYDGAASLPRAVAFALHNEGYGFAPYVLPDSLFI